MAPDTEILPRSRSRHLLRQGNRSACFYVNVSDGMCRLKMGVSNDARRDFASRDSCSFIVHYFEKVCHYFEPLDDVLRRQWQGKTPFLLVETVLLVGPQEHKKDHHYSIFCYTFSEKEEIKKIPN